LLAAGCGLPKVKVPTPGSNTVKCTAHFTGPVTYDGDCGAELIQGSDTLPDAGSTFAILPTNSQDSIQVHIGLGAYPPSTGTYTKSNAGGPVMIDLQADGGLGGSGPDLGQNTINLNLTAVDTSLPGVAVPHGSLDTSFTAIDGPIYPDGGANYGTEHVTATF
jgi:hypothetical protein